MVSQEASDNSNVVDRSVFERIADIFSFGKRLFKKTVNVVQDEPANSGEDL